MNTNIQDITEGRLVEFKRNPKAPGRPALGKVLTTDRRRNRATVKTLYGKKEMVPFSKVVRTWDEDDYRQTVEARAASSDRPRNHKPVIQLSDVPTGRVIEFKKKSDGRGRPALGRVVARDRKKEDTIVVATNAGKFSKVQLSNIVKVRAETQHIPPEVIAEGQRMLSDSAHA